MKRSNLFIVGVLVLTLASCIDHEVIPAPEPMVELKASFEGNVGGQFTQYTQYVGGYVGVSDISIQSSGGTSKAQYTFGLISNQSSAMVRIGVGSISWSSSLGTYRPELTPFNAFFIANTTPTYQEFSFDGFEVVCRTQSDSIFVSRANSTYAQTVEFVPSSIIQGSDSSGDYSKFICNFSCYVYNDWTDMSGGAPGVPMTDSILISNATYEGWFQR
ncbi:MAG: hypothetical protein QNL61_00440 [Crocinitomicaceae bacterium]|jgi:hypothetical protein